MNNDKDLKFASHDRIVGLASPLQILQQKSKVMWNERNHMKIHAILKQLT